MNKVVPWEKIPKPDKGFSVLRVDKKTGVPIYWGRDVNSQCLLIIELLGDHAAQFNKEIIALHGINTDLRNSGIKENQRLILTLERHVDEDLFLGLCETLIATVGDIFEPSTVLAVSLSHIKRWKAFMAGKKGRMLSAEEVRGLFSELKFLQKMLYEMDNELDALEAWQGPETSHQDFIFSDTAVEVKSLSGRERNTVKISSEDQLESLGSNLFLKVFRLVDMPESKASISLNELVNAVEKILTEAEAIEMFDTKLAKAGYVRMLAYDKPKFIVAEEQTYRVESEFPKIVRSELNTGLTRVGYEIKLESVRDFLCADKDVLGK